MAIKANAHDGDIMPMKEHLTDAGDLEDRIHYILLLELMNEEVEKLPEKCRMVF
ncbi:hypothetical protein HDF25_005227, partial [Pedobacter cryoconitis]|nr:hypothetical protein [Pedobacter cryoconitis]